MASARGPETPLSLSVSNPAAKMISAKDDAAVTMAVTKAMGDGDGDDDRWSPGEDFMLMVSDLFTDGDGTPLTQAPNLSVSSDKPAVASVTSSGQNITVNAVGLGMAMIRVTASVDPILFYGDPADQRVHRRRRVPRRSRGVGAGQAGTRRR